MNKNNLLAVMAVGALVIGAFMLYASADLLESMNPDPHLHHGDYSVGGSMNGEEVSGFASYTPITENGSFYNYQFEIYASGEAGEFEKSFLLIFDNKEVPYNSSIISSDETSRTYSTFIDGLLITFDVIDYCKVESFKIESDSLEIVGLPIQDVVS